MAARSAIGRAPYKTAGGLLLTAGATIVMGIITADALYTSPYNARMEISDLGTTENGVVLHPSATIFNLTMLVAGTMILTAVWFLHRLCTARRSPFRPACSVSACSAWGSSPATSIPSIRCSPASTSAGWSAGWSTRCCCGWSPSAAG
jgi:hypothetical protein